MAIEWLSTKINPPETEREIIAKNPLKAIGFKTAVKRCKIIRFNHGFTEEQIVEQMIEDGLVLWSYTDEQYTR